MSSLQWVLLLQARVMRFLMAIGMLFHKLNPPQPQPPAFTRTIRSTLSTTPGTFRVSVYTPVGYEAHRRNGFTQDGASRLFPCIINFHGGGFTLGASTDDARFVRHAMHRLDCVVISVDYRLAPEHPFPTAVDDGADAVLWAVENSAELGIDADALVLSGFSSGANLALTVPIRLHDHVHGASRPLSTTTKGREGRRSSLGRGAALSIRALDDFSSADAPPVLLKEDAAAPSSPSSSSWAPNADPVPPPPFTIRALAPFYPPTNYLLTRHARRATSPLPHLDIPPSLTHLFDASYLPGPSGLAHPYLSPFLLSGREMRAVYAGMRVLGVGCEGDMLCREGGAMMTKLARSRDRVPPENDDDDDDNVDDADDDVVYEGEEAQTVWEVERAGVSWRVVQGVAHAWDKLPFPSSEGRAGAEREYAWVCEGVGEALTRTTRRG